MKAGNLDKKTTHRSSRVPFVDAPAAPPRPARRQPTPVSAAELKEWVRRARDLPDIRWEKVQAMRDAIQSGSFDEARLDRLVDLLPAELFGGPDAAD
ncbi:MAG: hypothetical protein HY718_19720 [Planctomycetes bacterium]|nr:hypothetical protein [Planctomycetota bacterium]